MADNAMYDSRGFRLNIPTYSTEGNLTDRGFPDSKSGIGAAGATGSKVDVSSRNTTTTPKATGSGAGSATGYTAGVDLAGYLEAMRAQQRADAEAAYDRARNALNNAYSEASSAYGNIYNRGAEQLGRSYNNSRGKINTEAEDAFRQAYVNRMMSEKNLGQRLAAMGMSGGASESSMAGLINNYGNARSGIQRTLDTNLGDLEMKYQGNLADLYNAYQSNMAAIANQRASQLANLETQLANLNANMGGDYYSAMLSNLGNLQKMASNAVANQAAYTAPNAQTVTNTFTPANIQQANDVGGTATNWSKWQEELQRQLANGANINGAIASLRGTVDPQVLADYINSLR